MTTMSKIDCAEAGDALGQQFGFPIQLADVTMVTSYSGISLAVDVNQERVLAVEGIKPETMAPGDVQYTGTLNLAETPLGLRLVQVEANHRAHRVERLKSRLLRFNAAHWGNPLLDPYYVIASTMSAESVEWPAIRFVCQPEELAFTGTESVR